MFSTENGVARLASGKLSAKGAFLSIFICKT
jgi:hypothetical protein